MSAAFAKIIESTWQCRRWLVTCAMFALAGQSVSAQSIWELTPYRIQTWIVANPHPLIPAAAQQDLLTQIPSYSENMVGSVWRLSAETAPAAYHSILLRGDTFDADAVLSASKEFNGFDKLFILTIDHRQNAYQIGVRELDIQTRTWSPVIQRGIDSWRNVPASAFKLMCDIFVPIVRINRIEETQVTALAKAGALLRPESSTRRWQLPTEIRTGDVLQPFIRRTDRNGRVRTGGVKPIQWTLLVVTEQSDGQLKCQWHSGYRQPFSVRRSSRVQQLATVIKPRFQGTTLKLRNRREQNQPLSGYDIFSRKPGEELSEFVGRTDWRGQLDIPPDANHPIRILFVKSGNQFLAKLPIVPGHLESVAAPLRNDDGRLEAEGFLLGIQESLVDLVARREVLTMRIRQRIESGKLDEAEEMLNELQRLDTQEDFRRRVEQRKRTLTIVDAQVQQKIDRLFAETRTLLGQFLDPNRVRQLRSELDAARRTLDGGA